MDFSNYNFSRLFCLLFHIILNFIDVFAAFFYSDANIKILSQCYVRRHEITLFNYYSNAIYY